ncbi:helix-turn-helix domain-containing protein [Streptomyces clavuligerus]|nr:helix-turn-helix transcriptional regulator [Streptomyces clavuligerus]ANW21906.1 transcriptional regulator [Streptomyces clavuligerus]AXU16535.1 XRE family transcriptional regulator [Streptomyces clavuligerus]EDY52865.1 DNA-binding protein [Streptomyces clavuligerus]MBY6303469.1 helix-turn-helix transcriptional regulator [Streptomyces clavuligerus]QCS09298.1 XRE family transcriptional regulator [Streptomyces clavuligerus]
MPRANDLTPDRSARHLFGAKLRKYREAKNWKLEDLSKRVQVSKSHLSRIENATFMPPPDLPARLDALFGLDGTFQELFEIARNELHPDQFKRRNELEEKATVIKEYASQIVPGLLQTEEYARAQFLTHNYKATPEEIDKLLNGRIARQSLLWANPNPDYSIVLDESVLRRSFGGPGILRRQLAHLIDCALTRPSHTIQVMPFSHGAHGLMGGLLALWTLKGGQHVAYEESITTGTLLEDKTVVSDRVRRYDRLSAAALPPKMSVDFLRSVMEALPDEHHP